MTSRRSRLILALLAGGTVLSCSSDTTAPAPDGPTQYITVKRAWRPGERDSLLQFILATGAWGQYSDLASEAVPQWDSAVDVVVNPAWTGAGLAPGLQRAPAFASGWGTAGIDLRIVFDATPGLPVVKDSLDWLMLFWWNPADSTWKGYLVNATTNTSFSYVTVNTTNFNSSNGKTGSGGGEARLAAPTTYWEANGGQWRVTSTGSYGGLSTIGSGPFKGGNIQTGLMSGNTNTFSPVTMPRVSGTQAPASQSISYTFTNIYSQRMFCYFTPVPPPGGYTSCTGAAAAALVAAARAGRPMEMFTSGGPVRAPAPR